MIVADLDVPGIAIHEPEADPPLIVHRDRVLALPVTLERKQAVAGWNSEVVQLGRQVDILELPRGASGDLRRKTPLAPSRTGRA